ncbi:DUF3892 domain-containing protein [Curtobacterium sp. Leaf261]|uniref:DUF3892 domain-containing protein n=1 Tax=Curtobacterium sp. Leaf261 TaxID=1736311 RepID=UPI0006FE8A07|nr:DUF3892 domain-containing protein [Curtobacterium sp. Leaf261]KQO62235.1 hypothetical protein ASF23_10465 [Curtobacterium sp. Leaf261]
MNHTIEFVTRDHSGITTLVTTTGVIDVDSAIDEIKSGSTYFAGPSSFDRARVRIMTALGVAYLSANWDGSKRNNLHDLAQQMTRPVPTIARPRPASRTVGALWTAVAALRGRGQGRTDS